MDLPETRYSLIARLASAEDADAWQDFVQAYESAIIRYCRSRGLQDADALEVAQDVFLVAHRAAEKWEPSGHAGSFRAWIFETARRSCLKLVRNRTALPRSLGEESVEQESSDEDDSGREWQKWAFYAAAGKVQREVKLRTWQAFWKTTVENMDPREVARELDLSVGNVYTAKCRVMERIRKCIDQLTIQ